MPFRLKIKLGIIYCYSVEKENQAN